MTQDSQDLRELPGSLLDCCDDRNTTPLSPGWWCPGMPTRPLHPRLCGWGMIDRVRRHAFQCILAYPKVLWVMT